MLTWRSQPNIHIQLTEIIFRSFSYDGKNNTQFIIIDPDKNYIFFYIIINNDMVNIIYNFDFLYNIHIIFSNCKIHRNDFN